MPRSSDYGSKNRVGLKVLWIPTRRHHKSHQPRSNYQVQDTHKLLPNSKMSGHSPHIDLFDLKEGRSSPPPTTSKDFLLHNSSTLPVELKTDVATTALAEPLKEHGPGTNLGGFLDNTKTHATDDHISEEEPLKGHRPEAGDQKQHNGDVDKLDGKWKLPTPAPPLKKEDEDDKEEECTVKCLYYTMQCCECAIM